MNVPPFIPPQIEIAGSVADEKYPVRIAFLRRVVGLHSAFCGIVLFVALLPVPKPTLTAASLTTLGALLALSLVRGVAKGWRHEQVLSLICVPALVLGLAWLTRAAMATGCPFWLFGISPLAMLIYTMLCGRDISFMGMFVFTSIGAVVTVAAGEIGGWLPKLIMWEAIAGVVAYHLFYVYDLAALQTRRRLGEEVGAVLDLFRDLLNFTTYPIRVVNHWRRHRIWSRG